MPPKGKEKATSPSLDETLGEMDDVGTGDDSAELRASQDAALALAMQRKEYGDLEQVREDHNAESEGMEDDSDDSLNELFRDSLNDPPDDVGDEEQPDDAPIDSENDAEEPAPAEPPPPVLTAAEQQAQDRERADAIVDIGQNWGPDFATMGNWIADNNWLQGKTDNLTEQNCEIDTIREFRHLSELTKGQGREIIHQIEQFYLIRWTKGRERPIGKYWHEKQVSLREDLRRLREGEWVKPENEKKPKKRKGKAARKTTPRKRAKTKASRQEPVDEDDEDTSDSSPDEIPAKEPIKKKGGKGKGKKANDAETTDKNGIPITSITSEAQRDAALRRIYHNWQISSLHGHFHSRLHEDDVSDDEHIEWSVIELLRDLSEVSATHAQGEEIREDLEAHLREMNEYDLASLHRRITITGQDYHTAAERRAKEEKARRRQEAAEEKRQRLAAANNKDNGEGPAAEAEDEDAEKRPANVAVAPAPVGTRSNRAQSQRTTSRRTRASVAAEARERAQLAGNNSSQSLVVKLKVPPGALRTDGPSAGDASSAAQSGSKAKAATRDRSASAAQQEGGEVADPDDLETPAPPPDEQQAEQANSLLEQQREQRVPSPTPASPNIQQDEPEPVLANDSAPPEPQPGPQAPPSPAHVEYQQPLHPRYTTRTEAESFALRLAWDEVSTEETRLGVLRARRVVAALQNEDGLQQDILRLNVTEQEHRLSLAYGRAMRLGRPQRVGETVGLGEEERTQRRSGDGGDVVEEREQNREGGAGEGGDHESGAREGEGDGEGDEYGGEDRSIPTGSRRS
ncbi:uncharacterized protein J4E84_010043 [Alternaria hordeiaustralica]|uniref:uncharacterized protein n=1 Tax=Alternaria hordeiaustralica TaxID=1187925 RepID=UPI0020C58230|nr:uncharacterized protein J4E84_010043 [Alternaria hordeiaustralica]KAI4675448.1 hypothetical protein J4E84_010043 [Alternaria hordeiaustralica]